MHETKKNKIILDGYNMQLFAFFSNEYAMRHILTNTSYTQCVDHVSLLKEILRNRLQDRYHESHADSLIDRHAFFNYGAEHDLYSHIINLRIQKHSTILDDDATNDLDNLYSEISHDPYGKHLLSELTEISLNHGVYATRIDIFNKKDYSMESISEHNIHKNIEEIFFKRDITQKLLSDSLHAESPFSHQTLIDSELDVSGHIAIYIDPYKKDFDIDATIHKITSIISLFACEQQDSSTHTNEHTKHYLNTFFTPTQMKNVPLERYNRLLGLLMWDTIQRDTLDVTAAFLKLGKTIKPQTIQEGCTEYSHCEACSQLESCSRSAAKHYQTAKESIDAGALQKLVNTTTKKQRITRLP
ncbi:hypothetical protein [Nitratidesulfovibrio termitidis]|uniref:hypothetical protein n=1 Tax=Nitratidesulfovibrio termitidis TaxID=42252 RepID=UPI0012EB55EB|nr:hypothetical protein [Nitratidesulfovibrio termitidis]